MYAEVAAKWKEITALHLNNPLHATSQCSVDFQPFPALFYANASLLQLPFWTLITFGAYLLAKLGYGVLTFNDVPEAHEELMGQIDQARKELRAKGVTVD